MATPFLDRTIGAFLDMTPVIGDSDGFLEDECLMLRNAAANLEGSRHSVLIDMPAAAEGRPAFVVGSGPSIENDLPFLRENRDAAIVISGGTGLGVLLEAGIVPDLHCEIENVEDQSFENTDNEPVEMTSVYDEFIEPEVVEPVEDNSEGESFETANVETENFEGDEFASEDQTDFEGELNNEMDESFEDEFAAELEGETVAEPADDFAVEIATEPAVEPSTEDFIEPEFVSEDDIASIENTGAENVNGEAEAFVMPEFDGINFTKTVAQLIPL